MRASMHPGKHHGATPAARQAQRLERLKTLLQLTPAQESAWSQYTAALQPPATRAPRIPHSEWATLTTPERLDRMRALHEARTAAFQQRAEATKTFYASLSAAQKKAFDVANPMGMQGHAGGKHHRMHGHHRSHGGGHGMSHGHHPASQPQAPGTGTAG